MIKLRIPLAGAFCFTLLSCQVGVGTPGECAQTPENCQQISPNQLTGPNIEPPTTTSNASIVDNANSPVKILNLLAPDNFQIAEQTAQTLRVKWDIKEKTPHSYTLHLNGKTVAEGVNLATYTFTNLKTNEDYEIAIEAVNANGKSSLIKLSSFDGLKEKTGSGSTGSGSTGSGSTGSGSTGSGSTGSGSTGSGSTDSGSTDSGSTGSGSTDSGSTDSGSTDSGSTDSGSTDSGSTDSGSTDSGSTDSGSKCPKGSLISVCVGVGGIGGLGLGI